MSPLLSGSVETRGGLKLVDVVGLYGNKFSNVDVSGDTTQVAGFRPASCALSGLIVFPAVFKSLQASTMLVLQFPLMRFEHPVPATLGNETSTGIVFTAVSPSASRTPS